MSRPRVFITGARRGIGRGIAYAFAEAGYDVVINDVVEDAASAETLAGIAQRGGGAAFLGANIAEVSALSALAEQAFAAFGGLECLVNNAGIQVRVRGDMLETTPESFDALMATNLRGPFFLTQEVAKRMIAAGKAAHPRSIISLSSVNAVMPSINRAEYCISKTGVAMMSKLYAVRLADAGIGVFDVRPGVIATDMTAGVRDKYSEQIAAGLSPVRRWGEPADIGRVAVALASGDFHFSTGDAFYVDGGLHLHRL